MSDADELVRRFIIREYGKSWRGARRGAAHHLMRCPDVDVVSHEMDQGVISEFTPDPCTYISAVMGCPHQAETDVFGWTDFCSIPEVIAELEAFEEAERNPPPPPQPPEPEPPLIEYVQIPRRGSS